MRSFLSNTPRDSNENVFVIGCFQNNKIEKRWWREKSYPVPLHGVALPLKSLQQRLAWVPPASEAGDEPTPGDTGWPGHCPLQVSTEEPSHLRLSTSVWNLDSLSTFLLYFTLSWELFFQSWVLLDHLSIHKGANQIFKGNFSSKLNSISQYNFLLTINFLKIFWQFPKF